jgi:hypothetical protein
VLTLAPPGAAAAARRTDALLAVGRAHGVPAPRYAMVQELPGATVIVQEVLPGTPPTALGRRTVESMIGVNQRCHGILADRDDPAPSLYLREDGPGFCLHQPLAAYGRPTARLLAEIEQVGAAGLLVTGVIVTFLLPVATSKWVFTSETFVVGLSRACAWWPPRR